MAANEEGFVYRDIWSTKRLFATLWRRVTSFASMCCILCSRIPDSIGKDIEKACQSIYPLHDVFVRKVKMLKKPKFECKWSTAVM